MAIRRLSTSSVGSARRSWLSGRWLSSGLAVAAVACVGLSGWLVFGSIPASRRDSVATRDLQAETSKLQVLVGGEASAEQSFLLSGDLSYLVQFGDQQNQVEAVLRLAAADDPATVRQALAVALSAYRSFLSDHAHITAVYQSGDRSGATALALGPDRQARLAAQAGFAAAASEVVNESAREATHDATLTDRAGGALMILGLGLLVAAVELARRVGRQRRDAEALRDSEHHLRTLVDHIAAAVYTLDLNGVVLAWNPAATATFGWSEAEAVGKVLPFVSADKQGESAGMRAELAAGRPLNALESTRRRKDGTTIDVSTTAGPVLDDAGHVVGIIGITADITDRKRAEVELERNRRGDRQLAAIVTASADAILSVTPDGTVSSWNAGAEAMFGYSAPEIIGQPINILTRTQDREGYRERADRVAAGLSIVVEEIKVRKDGTEFPVAFTASPVLQADNTVVGVVVVARDITAQKTLEATLERRALHDELTGLPNRVLFVDRLALALARLPRHGGVVAVLFVDVDQFKVINDSLGHEQGDRLLAMVAERLTAAVRPGDTVARFGGDEFAVLCEDLHDQAAAVAVDERIQQLAFDPFPLDGRDHWVTVSAGIAIADSANPAPADLLRDADAAMYQAKDSGRSCSVVFAQSMRTRALRRLDIETSLRRAINEGELRLHYQPIVNLKTGRTDGVEALVRWQHPTEGLLPPSEFIPVAEETGLIVPLGEWVLGESCRQARAWAAEHSELAHLTVSVNLSGRQVAQADVVTVVANVLAATGLAPSRLVLEVTESVLMRDAAYAVTVLEALKKLGVQLSVDDFGTGYSSLSYLKKFPVNILKIDKSFVDGLGSDDDDAAIVAATVTLAHSLGLVTVAEGTETAIQVRALTELGCDKAQGYLFSPPQPAAALTQHLLIHSHYSSLFSEERRPPV